MTFPFGIPVTFLGASSTTRDADGNDIITYTSTVVDGCAFDPGGSTEITQAGDRITTTPTIYAPYGTVVGPIDRAVVNGVTYEVDGTPAAWASPFTGWQPGVAVKLKAVTG